MNISARSGKGAKRPNLKKLLKRISAFRVRQFIWYVVRAVILLGLCFMILYPLFLKFITSIKSPSDIVDPSVVFLPKNPTFSSYGLVFKSVNYINTFLYTLGFILLNSAFQILSCLMVAYGLARFKFFGKNIIFVLIVVTLLIPPQAMLMPLYLRFHFFGIDNLFRLWGEFSGVSLIDQITPFLLLSMTAVSLKNGLYIFLIRQYFRNVPKELEEAASIDGCSAFKTFYRIMAPGALPIILTVFLLSFVWQWNDNYYAKTFAPNLPLLSNKLSIIEWNLPSLDVNVMNALTETAKFFLLITPLVIVYIFTQRFFTESIEKSGMVG